MSMSSNAEFAQFRFVRDAAGGVISLPAQGIDEKNLLVLDCERWGLARLHIFEGAAVRQDMLEAFQDELRQVADIRSDSVSRLITWGRDSEELFYADEMQDGEPLPSYLDRAGGVPFAVAGEWISQLFAFFEEVPRGVPSFDRFTTLNFQVVVDRYHEVRPVFSEFYGWTKPGAQVQEHAREWYLAQIFCSLIAGVPVRTFYRESLPRNFDELRESTQEALLLTLSESEEGAYDRLKHEMIELSRDAESVRREVPLPRLLVREWMGSDLAQSYPGEAGFAFSELNDSQSELYAISSVIRGKESFVQVLPGPESISRDGWLNQHHDATRRPGRPMLNQLHVNYIEDRNSLTLVGEERVDGVDLSALLLRIGPRNFEESLLPIRRVFSALESLEKNTGSCAVWWLPPENVLFLTGSSSLIGSVHLLERKGQDVWSEWGVKLRLHQTTSTLREGVNQPGPVRLLSKIPGKKFEAARRSAVALPLIFFVLTCQRFRWRRTVASQSELPDGLSSLLEHYRMALLENPDELEESLVDEYLAGAFLQGEEGESQPEKPSEEADDGFEAMLDGTLSREPIELEEATQVVPAKESVGEEAAELVGDEPEWDEEEYVGDEPVSLKRFVRGWWVVLWAVIFALILGYVFAGWSSRLGKFKDAEEIRFPVTEYEVPPPPEPSEVVDELQAYLLDEVEPDLLTHAGALENPESRTLIDEFLSSRIEDGDGTAARLDALLAGLEGAPMNEILGGLTNASRFGDPKAQFDLAVLVMVKGLGNQDLSTVREFLNRSATSGNPDARELLAVLLVRERKPREARRLIESAAQENHLGARFHLGLFAANGVGGQLDPMLAAEQFELAAAQGEPRAMFALGRCFEAGFGKQADFTEATRWIKMAAALGHQGAVGWCQAREIEVDTESKEESGQEVSVPN